MLYLDLTKFQEAFDSNWHDWCKGGPRPEGYTRKGMPTVYKSHCLSFVEKTTLPVEDVLAKNRLETHRWHMEFLESKLFHGSKFHWKNTFYYYEYLKPRYNDLEGEKRSNEFVDLLLSVATDGVKKPVWVADLGKDTRMRFRYFRFDGCHRTCCAKACKMATVPVLLFRAEELG